MKQLLESSILQLCEMRDRSGMALADKARLDSVIATLEAIERQLEYESDGTRRHELIFRFVELASNVVLKILFGHDRS